MVNKYKYLILFIINFIAGILLIVGTNIIYDNKYIEFAIMFILIGFTIAIDYICIEHYSKQEKRYETDKNKEILYGTIAIIGGISSAYIVCFLVLFLLVTSIIKAVFNIG